MEPINGVGVTDYSAVVPKAQNNNEYPIEADYTSIPEVYEPQAAQAKSGFGAGALLISGLAGAGIAGIAGYKMGGKDIKKFKIAADDAIKKYETISKEKEALKTAKEEAEKTLNEYRTENNWFDRLKRLFGKNNGYSKEETEARKAAQEAAKDTKKAEKDVKKAEKSEKTDETKKD